MGLRGGGQIISTSPITITPSTSDIIQPAGTYQDNIIVKGDPDLISGNIKAGANIFNIAGSLIEGKQWAQGSVLLDANSRVTVNGLAFTPDIILLKDNGYVNQLGAFSVYTPNSILGSSFGIMVGQGAHSNPPLSVVYDFFADGFSVQSPYGTGERTYNWIAFKW